MSCHQPFRPDGSVHPASVDAIRACYQARYRQFWAFPELRRLQARWPTWCTWDDHEIVNDWGARRMHQQPAWRRLFEGARQSFVDYQASRTMDPGASWPSAFHQAFGWGSAATFMMDLSSQRTLDDCEAQVYGDDQLTALTAFLHTQRARPVICLVLSDPLVYLPDWVVTLGERLPGPRQLFATRWNAAQNRSALDRLLGVLRTHQRTAPGQTLVLLSGDVHQGAERVRVARLEGARPGQRNPFNGLNVGVVSVEEREVRAAVRFELVTYDEGGPGAARVAYDSGWL
jgi:hypothetical protein